MGVWGDVMGEGGKKEGGKTVALLLYPIWNGLGVVAIVVVVGGYDTTLTRDFNI